LTTDRQRRGKREIEHWVQDSSGKGSCGAKYVPSSLDVSVLADPLLAPEVEGMAHEICDSDADADAGTGAAGRRSPSRPHPVRDSRRQLITRLFVDPAQVYSQQLRVIKMVLGDYCPRTLPIKADAIMDMLSPKPFKSEEKLATSQSLTRPTKMSASFRSK
jgi:hypothetical protein